MLALYAMQPIARQPLHSGAVGCLHLYLQQVADLYEKHQLQLSWGVASF